MDNYIKCSIRESLEKDGYCRVTDIFSERDLYYLKLKSDKLIQRWKEGKENSSDFWNYVDEQNDRILYRIHNFEKHFPEIKKIVKRPAFKKLIRKVFGVDIPPRVFALIIKMEGKGAAVPWHRDIDQIGPAEAYNFSIYLDNSTMENGCLEVVPGTHKKYDDYSKNIDPSKEKIPVFASSNEVIIHDVRLFHGSGFSKSQLIRRSVVIEYNRLHLNF